MNFPSLTKEQSQVLLGCIDGILVASFHSVPKKDKKNSATSSWIFSCYPPPLSKWMKRKLLPVAGGNPATGSQIFSCYQHLVTRKKAIAKAKRFGHVEQKWKWFFEDLKLFWAHATWYFVPTGLTPPPSLEVGTPTTKIFFDVYFAFRLF